MMVLMNWSFLLTNMLLFISLQEVDLSTHEQISDSSRDSKVEQRNQLKWLMASHSLALRLTKTLRFVT